MPSSYIIVNHYALLVNISSAHRLIQRFTFPSSTLVLQRLHLLQNGMIWLCFGVLYQCGIMKKFSLSQLMQSNLFIQSSAFMWRSG